MGCLNAKPAPAKQINNPEPTVRRKDDMMMNVAPPAPFVPAPVKLTVAEYYICNIESRKSEPKWNWACRKDIPILQWFKHLDCRLSQT
jgi:hypothetical protein